MARDARRGHARSRRPQPPKLFAIPARLTDLASKTIGLFWKWLAENPETLVSLLERPEQFDLFVLGGDAGWSTYDDGGTFSITREVKIP